MLTNRYVRWWCSFRAACARRELLKLKTEARSVERFREPNNGMEVKPMQLQLEADDQVGADGLHLLWGEWKHEGDAVFECAQTREKQMEALKAIIQKPEGEIRRKPPPRLIISEDEVEEHRRAKETVAQEIPQLPKVQLHVRQMTRVSFPCCCGSFSVFSF